MPIIFSGEQNSVDLTAFSEIAGDEYIKFIIERAPTKVKMRVANACYHFDRAIKLVDVDEEMGAIRLIAAEEELVVAIFEWLKLNADHMPEHKDFVGKFKNHVVKLAFYPVLQQFRFILEDMLEAFAPEGLESAINWKAKPVIESGELYLSMQNEEGKEIWKHQPLHIDLRRGEVQGNDIIPLIVADMEENIKNHLGQTLKEYVFDRADYRNQLLYASDGYTVKMNETLSQLIDIFKLSLRDLLWVLALILGGKPISKDWGLASQFIGAYREVLVRAKAIKRDGAVATPSEDGEQADNPHLVALMEDYEVLNMRSVSRDGSDAS